MVGRFRFSVTSRIFIAVSCLTVFVTGPVPGPAGAEEKAAKSETDPAAQTAIPTAVVELFTSQGCGACPPADAFLGDLARRPDILALSWSVDYWNYLGWHDTLARPEHADRQRDYNRALGLSGVYTPQMVINGAYQAIGSRRDDVLALIEQAAEPEGREKAEKEPETRGQSKRQRKAEAKLKKALLHHVLNENSLEIKVGKGKPEGEASLWLIGYAHHREVPVDNGENTGRTLAYHNVVVWSDKIGSWSGAPVTISSDVKPLRDAGANSYAILVQDGDGGKIVTAVSAELQ